MPRVSEENFSRDVHVRVRECSSVSRRGAAADACWGSAFDIFERGTREDKTRGSWNIVNLARMYL